MELKEFQLNAVKSLFEAMDKPVRDIILKSPTGSGKTIILTYFMHQYIQSYPKTVFVWLTPGKGNLEEQSKAKMDKYIHASQTKLLSDVMTAGFEENDSCFINWEKLTKKGNNALKDSERTNFLEHIEHALNDGLRFIIIVDESHQNNTIKADEIIQYFRTEKIIRCSATPKGIAKAEVIEIPEEEVIAAGLIKKMLVINQDFPQTVETEDQTAYLLERALQKQREILTHMMNQHKRCISECRVEILQSPLDILSYRAYSAVLPSSGGRFFCVLIEKLRNFSKTPCQTAPLIQSK